jgi:biopolymer transport protein ExbD
MNIRRRNRLTSEVSTSSLNDIMFFLLLFFLITSTLVSPNVMKLLLPKADSGKAMSKQNITLSVSSDLQYYIENKPVAVEALEPTLLQALAGKPEPTVILKVDKTVQIQNLVDLLNIGNRNKIKMVLATENSKK